MKNYVDDLNKAFESRVRLGLMSLLMVHESVDFTLVKEHMSLTDGNLASHIQTLEKLGYVEVLKQFIGKKPHTSYRATDTGRQAFKDHLDALEKLIKQTPF
ncbi:MAG: winged helix-turn-helix domain-containing protein [Spirosomataceae bacterium]